MSYPLSPCTYQQIVQALPQPSAAQRERFLRHVATARRWSALLPIDGGVPVTLFLNPRAGSVRKDPGSGQSEEAGEAVARYREAFGFLDYASPAARGLGVLTGADLGLPRRDTYYILDEEGRAAPLPPELLAVATCSLNATIALDAAALLDTLPLRVPLPAGTAGEGEPLAPIADDEELRAFAENYVREELAGFQCPADREAWEVRQLEAFRQLYAPRNAAQLARLRHALDAMLTWVYQG